MKNKYLLLIFGLGMTLLFLAKPVYGQQDAYAINLRRNFGYGGGVNIRGTFTIHLVGDETAVERVEYFIDDALMGTVDIEPFDFRFHTDDYGFGTHRLWAEVFLRDGTSQSTPTVQYNFVSPREERRQVGTLVGGLVGVIVLTIVIVAVIQAFVFKRRRKQPRQPGQARNYGLLGGTICPKCGHPFPRHVWGLNLMVGRLDRCDHCGKWVMTQRASPTDLKAAEQAEDGEDNDQSTVFSAPTSQQEQADRLEDTKYIDRI